MDPESIFQTSMWLVVGLLGISSNICVIYVIAKCRSLRFNAYYMAAMLALVDMLNGWAFVSFSIMTFVLTVRNQTTVQIPAWQCAINPAVFLFPVAYHGGTMMILLIACDRLLSVSAPIFYYKLTKRRTYTAAMIGFCGAYTLGIGCYFFYDMLAIAYPGGTTMDMLCVAISSEPFRLYDFRSTLIFPTVAVLLMIVTLILLQRRQSSKIAIDQSQPNHIDESTARDARAARMMAMVSFNTFVMWVIPSLIISAIENESWGWQVSGYLWLCQPMHGVINLAIYFRKGSQFREAFLAERRGGGKESNENRMYKNGGGA